MTRNALSERQFSQLLTVATAQSSFSFYCHHLAQKLKKGNHKNSTTPKYVQSQIHSRLLCNGNGDFWSGFYIYFLIKLNLRYLHKAAPDFDLSHCIEFKGHLLCIEVSSVDTDTDLFCRWSGHLPHRYYFNRECICWNINLLKCRWVLFVILEVDKIKG